MLPAPIQKLSDEVVQRIAAGEILHRPVNAVKELLENSIDAGATQISVVLRDGGLSLLQVQDNGHGINRDDLAIICERFTTSKLQKYEDLLAIGTFGFRGEALAALSHVSRLTILSKTANSSCAYKAFYIDGKLSPSSDGGCSDPKPSPGNIGTTITATDLFYNVPIRRKSFKNENDEYMKCLELVTRYSIHYPTVSFTCRKLGTNSQDICTRQAKSSVDVLTAIYPRELCRELLSLNHSSSTLSLRGLISSPGYSLKKLSLILFINNRLVESATIKRVIETVYLRFLMKGQHPFVYLAIDVPSHMIDVNVHPTKREVQFLDEDILLEHLAEQLSAALSAASSVRNFTATPVQNKINDEYREKRALSVDTVPEYRLVRTDPKARKLESFNFTKHQHEGMVSTDNLTSVATTPSRPNFEHRKLTQQKSTNLTSILQLRSEIDSDKNESLISILQEHAFVGVVDNERALIQHGTRLMLVNYSRLCGDLFYQIILKNFECFECFLITPEIHISELLELALSSENVDQSSLLDNYKQLLHQKSELLAECFGILISEDLSLTGMPILIPGLYPSWNRLPEFFLRLASRVDWKEEKTCFRGIATHLAWLHVPDPRETDVLGNEQWQDEYRWMVEHKLFNAIRSMQGTESLLKSNVFTNLTDLTSLYRIFERC